MAGPRVLETHGCPLPGGGGRRSGHAHRWAKDVHLPGCSGSTDELRPSCTGKQCARLDLNGNRRSCCDCFRRRHRVQQQPEYSRRPGPGWDAGTHRGIGRHAAYFLQSRGWDCDPRPDSARGACMKKVRILIADDHGIVRTGLRLQLERNENFEVIGEAADGRDAVRLAEELVPDIVIMDIAMPNLNGIQAAAQIVKGRPATGVIMLSMHSDEAYITRTLAAGAKGYLLKENAEVDLYRAIEVVAQGKPFFSPAIANTLLEDYMRQMQQRGLQDSYDLLTDREKEILQLLAEGKSNKDVAVMLNLSTNTVETHRNRIMQKLDLHSAAEIVLYAVRKRIIS